MQQERLARLMALQEKISAQRLAQKIGKTIQVLIDEADKQGAVARSHADAPEIDGLVYIENGQSLKQGDVVTVRVTHSDEHDLWAEII